MRKNDYLKHLDRAFTEMPPELSNRLDLTFRRGEEAVKQRYKILSAISVAAVLAVLCAALALAAGTLVRPQADKVMVTQGGGGDLGEAGAGPSDRRTTAPTGTPNSESMSRRSDDPIPVDTDEQVYYANQYGKYFHLDEHCGGMRNALPCAFNTVQVMGKQACPACVKGAVPELTYFATEEGNYYHILEDCSGMQGAYSLSEKDVKALGRPPCPECLPTTPTYCWATPQGTYFHKERECMGMHNARVYTVIWARHLGKTACPVCAGGYGPVAQSRIQETGAVPGGADENKATPEPTPTPMPTPEATPLPAATDALTIVYTQPKSNYYHSDPACSGMVGAIEWTEASAVSVGKQPCPVCVTGAVAPFVTNTPAPKPEVVEAPVFYTAGGVYYHGNDQCSGMLNAGEHTLAEALESGKQRCPVCQPGEPDHYDLFVAAFGQGLEALLPGYAYSHCGGNTSFFDEGAWFVTDGEAWLRVCQTTSFLKADGGDFRTHSPLGTVLEDVFCVSFYAETLDNLWPFLSETEAGQIAHAAKDEALEDALDELGLDMSLSLEEGNVWAAIGSDGRIRELEIYYIDDGSACSVILGWVLTDEGYALKSRVDLGDFFANAEPTRVSDEARDIAQQRYICGSDDYYHADRACPQLAHMDFEAVSRQEAVDLGRAPCLTCQPDAPLDKALFIRAFGEAMYLGLMPDFDYAFTRHDSLTGETSWIMRSEADGNTYGTLATFQTRMGSENLPMPENFEEGGVRVKVWMNQEADWLSMLRRAPEPIPSLVKQAEEELSAMPSMDNPEMGSPLGWNLWVNVCFDAARENITSVDFCVDGPDQVRLQWQRTEDGRYELPLIEVNAEGLG